MIAKELLVEAGEEGSFWGLRIIEAEQVGHFTEEDEDLAADWVTCACGKQDPRIPRTAAGQPLDTQLHSYGCEFGAYVKRSGSMESIYFAAKVLLEIENRAVEILGKQNGS